MIERQTYRLRSGNIGNLKISSERLDDPGPGQVQIRVKSIGLNFADIFAIWGLYSATPKGSFIPGLEYSGVINRIGPDVPGVSLGDRVMGIIRFGAYTDVLNIDARYIVPIPSDWSFEQGASFLVQVMTAYYALFELGNLQVGQTVLIHSGAGGVGIFANRLAKQLQAYTIGSTSTVTKKDFMLAEGYNDIIVRSGSFATDLERVLNGRPLHLVMECIGGRILKAGLRQLAPQGRMVVYGSAQYASTGNKPQYLSMLWKYIRRPKIDPLSLPNSNRSVMGFNLIWLYHEAERMHDLLKKIHQFDIGVPYVGRTFPFSELPQAIRLFQTGTTMGKVVVNVG
ncbi:MAG: zinc-binding dehydrogenase [Saprospiraceae bacterium]|nr:zinc-binding dehydrogenase [Saprospiraceae bacterium]